MGWRDRPYAREGYDGSGQPQMRMRFGSGFTPAVLWLMIANVAAFLVDFLVLRRQGINLARLGGLNWLAAVEHFEVYRFVTYMFIHGGIWHIGMNMLVLYFFGPALERHMGTRKFLWFYFACGLAGGAAFLAYGWAIAELNANVIGASGAALGVLVGYAVLYPNARIIFLIVQMKARTLALIYAAITVLYVLADPAEGGGVAHAAHLGGIVCAWVWFYWVPRWRGTVRRAKLKLQHGAWDRKLKAEADEQAAVDAILDKIRQKGLASLSRAEKKKLKDATRRQQEQDARRARGNRDTYM